MLIEELLLCLQKVTKEDIIELGEDVDGLPMYAIKICDKICSFKYGDMDADTFPEWRN